jgi:hypothetical protein
MDGVKPIEQVRAEGARRRRLEAIRAQRYHQDLLRWSIGLACGGGVLAAGLSILSPVFPVYGLFGAAAGWYISTGELNVFGGMICYGGGYCLLASLCMTIGLETPHVFMSVLWLSMLVAGAVMGLVVQLREWHIERALALLADTDVEVHNGSTSSSPREVPTPDIDPELHRPGYVNRPPRRKNDVIAFVDKQGAGEEAEDDPSNEQDPPLIIDDEGFRPPDGRPPD